MLVINYIKKIGSVRQLCDWLYRDDLKYYKLMIEYKKFTIVIYCEANTFLVLCKIKYIEILKYI